MKKRSVWCIAIILILTLTGCKRDDYNEAISLMQNKKWDEAKVVLETLDGYKDSSDKIKQCDYNRAILLINVQDYEGASRILSTLDYENSSELNTYCQDQITKLATYNQMKSQLDKALDNYKEAASEAAGAYRDLGDFVGEKAQQAGDILQNYSDAMNTLGDALENVSPGD